MKNRLNQIARVAVLLAIFFSASAADTPVLERVLTLSVQGERLDATLKKISLQGGFTFSYNPAIIDGNKIVSHSFVNKTVREILDQLFSGTIQYKARGKYIILTKSQISSSPKEPEIVSGYVVDESTGERLKNVSVYDPVSLSSTITDSYGYFEIKIDKPREDLRLSINRQNYTDTLVAPVRNGRLLNIPMKINKDKINILADSVGKKMGRLWQKTKQFTVHQVNLANIDDTLYRKFQFSVVPFIGTNHALSGNVINDYSLNMLGGLSLGVRKLEVGGIFNTVRGDVHGVQLAGIFNAVAGSVEGWQLAGVFNANRGPTTGAQFAGIFNFNWNDVRYFSAAGTLNFTRGTSRAVQIAGIGNITLGDQMSPHGAGLFNFTAGNAKSQLSGIYGFTAGNLEGAQVSGILNFAAKKVRGAQVAGILNFAGKEIDGAQIGGVLNYSTRVKGTQIGLINISDTVQGVPVGLISIVMKGYHKFEISADEIFYTNIAFRTGVRRFYNILSVGAKPNTFGDRATHWTFGYGVGTAPKLSKKLSLNLDLTSNHIVQGNEMLPLNLLNKFYVGVDYHIFKKLSLTAGATLNGYLTDTTREGYWNLFSNYQPHLMYNHTYSNDVNLKMWVGGKIGIRFL